jgi:hypothetical protein
VAWKLQKLQGCEARFQAFFVALSGIAAIGANGAELSLSASSNSASSSAIAAYFFDFARLSAQLSTAASRSSLK